MSFAIYPIRWRLVFLDNRELDEMPQGSTIMDRPKHPVELHLIDLTGQVVMGVPIPPGCKPIFYRQRSIGVSANGKVQNAPQLDATVFGYGREGERSFEGKLWLWRNGQALDCPAEHIAQTMIELQISA